MTSDDDVLEAINVDTYPDGTSMILDAVFGNTLEYNSTTGDVTSARAMMQVGLLLCHYTQNESTNQYQFLVKPLCRSIRQNPDIERFLPSKDKQKNKANNHIYIQSTVIVRISLRYKKSVRLPFFTL